MKKFFTKIALAASLCTPLALMAPALAAAAVTNGGFETGTSPGVFITLAAIDSTNIAGWTVESGTIDYIGSYWQSSPGGGRSLDLTGYTPGAISQTFATVPGASYEVSFDLSGNPAGGPSLKTLTVSATGGASTGYSYDTVAHGTTLADMQWETKTYTFVATGLSTTLTFASTVEGYYGPALDNVVVTEIAPPVACPAYTTQSTVLETVTVAANNPSPTLSSMTFDTGTNYILRAYGMANAGDGINFDARYSYRTPTSVGWTDAVSTYEYLGTTLLDLTFNGTTPWGVFTPPHEYKALVVGDGNQASFLINDVYYPNNTGSLSVDTYSCMPDIQYVTGGGNYKVKSSKTFTTFWTFGGSVWRDEQGDPQGEFELVDHISGVGYHFDNITSIDGGGSTIIFTAEGTTQGQAKTPVAATFTIVDGGEPGSGDTISVVFTSPTPPAGISGPVAITGGNFQVLVQ